MLCVSTSKAAAIGLVLACVPLVAQTDQNRPDLVTDRPDFTESAIVVPRRSLQLESGLTWLDFDSDNRLLTAPEVLLRWGAFKRVEIRVGLPNYLETEGGSATSNSSIGIKAQLGPTHSNWDVAVIAVIVLPTGSEELESDQFAPVVILTGGRELTPSWSFGSQLSGSRLSILGKQVLDWGATAVFGRSLSPQWSTFLELAGATSSDGSSPLLFHHGYTHLVRRNLQIDGHVAVGLNDAAPEWLVGAGLSIRP